MAMPARALTDLTAMIEKLTDRVDTLGSDTREQFDKHSDEMRTRFDRVEERVASLEHVDAKEAGRREVTEKVGAVALAIFGMIGGFILSNIGTIISWLNPPPPSGHH